MIFHLQTRLNTLQSKINIFVSLEFAKMWKKKKKIFREVVTYFGYPWYVRPLTRNVPAKSVTRVLTDRQKQRGVLSANNISVSSLIT